MTENPRQADIDRINQMASDAIKPIPVPPLLDLKSYYIILGSFALAAGIGLGAIGVSRPIIVGGTFVTTLVINRIARKREWVG